MIITKPAYSYADDTRKCLSRAATFCSLGRHTAESRALFKIPQFW